MAPFYGILQAPYWELQKPGWMGLASYVTSERCDGRRHDWLRQMEGEKVRENLEWLETKHFLKGEWISNSVVGVFFAVSRDPDMLIGSLIFHARANKTLGLGKVKPSLFFCSLYSVSIYLQHFAENTNSLEAFKYIILIKNLTVTQKFKIVIKEN